MIFQLENVYRTQQPQDGQKTWGNFWKKQRLPSSKSEKKFTLALESFCWFKIDHCLDINQEYEVPRSLIFTWQNDHQPPQPQDWQKTSGSFQKKFLQSIKSEEKKSMLGLEPLLVEIEHVLDITQKYETPGFLIFTCQNAHRPPQPQEGQETWAKFALKFNDL